MPAMETELLAVAEMAYRKHNLADDRIGWDELGDRICDVLCNFYGGNVFAKWVEQFDEDDGLNSLAEFAKKVK